MLIISLGHRRGCIRQLRSNTGEERHANLKAARTAVHSDRVTAFSKSCKRNQASLRDAENCKNKEGSDLNVTVANNFNICAVLPDLWRLLCIPTPRQQIVSLLDIRRDDDLINDAEREALHTDGSGSGNCVMPGGHCIILSPEQSCAHFSCFHQSLP